MKKNLLLIFVAGFTTCVNAQQATLDFESLPLTDADTFYNGSDDAGLFNLSSGFGNTLSLNNFFDDTWGAYWTGFAYSNMTDVTTPGYGNQYSSFAGSGANGSSIYGLCYSDGLMSFTQNTYVDSLKITNTTYAALSMLNGDAYGKQFGSTMHANGDPDGTNGEDFFKVWFVGYDQNMQRTDSVDFYLADYRFSDNNLDYIVSTWQNVDLSSLGSVRHIGMRFESSDMSFGYPNTPTYCAIDNISITNLLGVDEEFRVSSMVYPNPTNGNVTISDFNGRVEVLTLKGEVILQLEAVKQQILDLSSLPNGLFFLRLTREDKQELLKITKY